MPVLDQKFDILTNLHVFTDVLTGGLNTTLGAAALKGATALTLASGTNSANGDDIRIGTGETMELARIATGGGTTSIVLEKELKFDHLNGEAVVEQQANSFGTPEADGFRFSFGAETLDVFSAVARLAYGTLTGYVDIGASWRYPTITVDSIALSLGIPRANVIGNGTAAAQTGTVGPRLFTTDGVAFGGLTNVNVVITGLKKNGSHFRLDLYNASFDPTALNLTLARGALTTVPVRMLASSAAAVFTNAAFVPATPVLTYGASKGEMFSEITKVATLTDSGTATTLATGIAAGVYEIPATLATGIVAGDYVRLGAGDLAEFHLVHAISTNTLVLRTQVLRNHLAAVPIVRQTVTDYNVALGGFTMVASGTVDIERSELFRTSLAYVARNVALTLGFNLDAIKPESFYLALGIPASELVSDVLPLGGKIASAAAATLLFRGLTQGGRQISAIGWNGSVVVGGETQFTQAATALLPISYKPNGLNMWENV